MASKSFRRFTGTKRKAKPEQALDYKNLSYIQGFLTPQYRILSRKRTGFAGRDQRRLAAAIKHSRFLGLLPYTA
jgi:small subunit ribosomal protein S18